MLEAVAVTSSKPTITKTNRTREISKEEATPVAKRLRNREEKEEKSVKEAPAKKQQVKEAPAKKQQVKKSPDNKKQEKEAPAKKQQKIPLKSNLRKKLPLQSNKKKKPPLKNNQQKKPPLKNNKKRNPRWKTTRKKTPAEKQPEKEAPAEKQPEKEAHAEKQPEKAPSKSQIYYAETSTLPYMDYPFELATIEPFTEERAVVTEQSAMKRATVTSANVKESNFEDWELLGFLHARATKQLVDNVFTKSHKLCVHPNVPQLLKKEMTGKLYRSLYWAYLESTEKKLNV